MTIVPFKDDEIPAAMSRMVQDEAFISIAKRVYPDLSAEQIKEKLAAIKTVEQFQHGPMLDVFNQIKKHTITEFSYDVSSKLDPSQPYLFVSNHRDITLDALILESVFCNIGFPTTKVAFGSNLLNIPFFEEIGRANKLFSVERGGSPKSYYHSLAQLSQYIRDSINQGESVWISQRNGRTKNGLDRTDPAIVKMFALSGEGSVSQRINALHIVPVAISYEWEPCATLKAIELANTIDGVYHKKPGEDALSVKTGIVSPKGKVHLSIGDPITPEQIMACNECHKSIAACLDREILSQYCIFHNNYIAADICNRTSKYSCCYSVDERIKFNVYAEKIRQSLLAPPYSYDPDFVQCVIDNVVDIYANPLVDTILE